MSKPTTIERAFEIARSSKPKSVEEIGRQLTREGFEGVHQHLAGVGTRKELKRLIAEARRN